MNLDSHVPIKDQKEKQNAFFEVINAEKQLWALIHSKGILHAEVRDLYCKARSGYVKIILSDPEEVELQDVEYSLWKLHYKHIDEFRKRIRRTSGNTESTKSTTLQNVDSLQSSIDCHMELFKSFLSEATEFYQDLISKLRRCYGLAEDHLFYENSGVSCAIDPTKLRKCQYSCHRLLVCLGDLARYRELCKKLDFQRHNWSVAATYYFKATLVWPDSGNPQNQLALLATYIGDDFLALYHCIRSLAIKEAFPDAWDNLILLFEKNRSSHFQSLSMEAHFNFMNPSERSTSLMESKSSGASLNNDKLQATEHISSAKSDLWPLFVRMISFFFIESSLEEFPCTFASTMRELDSLLALDDTKLKSALESYQHMDLARTGPYRALQMVSVLVFIISSLTERLEHKETKEKNIVQQPMLIQWALAVTFICLGRLVERCLKSSTSQELSLLLPAVLVFVDWLVGMLDKVEIYGAYEKVRYALSYFLDNFVELLNKLGKNEGEFKYKDHTALWEDYELRGFAPVACAHMLLDFTAEPKLMCNFDTKNVPRARRIFHAAMKLVHSSAGSQKWILYDNSERKFCITDSKELSALGEAEVAESRSDPEGKELHQLREVEVAEANSGVEIKQPLHHEYGTIKENGKESIGESETHPSENGKSVAIEEEEVILFKPITRYNSAPLYTSIKVEEMNMEGMNDQATSSDECLRRATSLFTEQNQSEIDPLSFRPDASNFRNNKPFKQQEPILKDTPTYPAGPPSLSAWVLNRESSTIEKERGTRDFFKPGLSPIDEIASASLAGLFISETKDSVIDSRHVSAAAPYSSPPPYSAPVPSAPLLPDDAAWFSGNSSSFPEGKSLGKIIEADGILGAPPLSTYTNWSATNYRPFGYVPSYQPVLGLSSSEWLHQYANQSLDHQPTTQVRPVHFYAPGGLENFYGHEASRFDLCDRWGNPLSSNPMVYLESPQLHPAAGSPLIYGGDEQRREKLFANHQRTIPYRCGDLRADQQPPLLQYLKEKEWKLQQESQVRGPTYMGN